MNADPENFYARLASAQAAEDRRARIDNPPKPRPTVTTTLDDLKKRATAAELTLIEATIAAIRPAVVTEVNATLMEWLTKNDPTDMIDRCSQEPIRRWYHDLKNHLSS